MTTRWDVGRVLAVGAVLAGDQLASDHPAGSTTLTVEDATDFAEDGGLLVIGEETLPYSSADEDTGVIVLGQVDSDGTSSVATWGGTAVWGSGITTWSGTGATALQATLGADAAEGDQVYVFDPLAGAPAQDVVAHVAVEGEDFDADAIEVVIAHALISYLPEGIREPDEGESVTIEWRDGVPSITDVNDQAPRLVSDSGGWDLGPESADFADVNVSGTLGAEHLAAGSITLGEQDLSTALDAPAGLVAYANIATGTNTATITAADGLTLLFTFSLGVLQANRRYLVMLQAHANSTATGDEFDFRLTFDSNGEKVSQADPGNNILDGSLTRWVSPTAGLGNSNVKVHGFVETDNTWGAIVNGIPVYMGLLVEQISGTGGVSLGLGSANRSLQLVVLDVGSTATPVTSSWSQKSKAGGGAADPDPVSDRKKSWTATGSRAYDGDGTRRVGDENTNHLYQGYYSGTHGNTRSAISFNSSAIQAELAGATIKRVRLRYRVRHAYYNSGMTVRLRTHANGSLPTTWGGISGADNEITRANAKPGVTYTEDLPTSVGDDFASGAAKGFIVGPGPNTAKKYYGYLYGPGSSSPPELIIDYEK